MKSAIIVNGKQLMTAPRIIVPTVKTRNARILIPVITSSFAA